jgi:hypothetical protein
MASSMHKSSMTLRSKSILDINSTTPLYSYATSVQHGHIATAYHYILTCNHKRDLTLERHTGMNMFTSGVQCLHVFLTVVSCFDDQCVSFSIPVFPQVNTRYFFSGSHYECSTSSIVSRNYQFSIHSHLRIFGSPLYTSGCMNSIQLSKYLPTFPNTHGESNFRSPMSAIGGRPWPLDATNSNAAL